MTDCSQLPAELAAVQQQRNALPAHPELYCRGLYPDPEDEQRYKACLRDLDVQIDPLDSQINFLTDSIKTCNALIGTWVIQSDNDPETNGQQFTIVTWDNQSDVLNMTFRKNDGSSDYVSTTFFNHPDWPGKIHFFWETYPNDPYDARLDTNIPQFLEGNVSGKIGTDGQVVRWLATKL